MSSSRDFLHQKDTHAKRFIDAAYDSIRLLKIRIARGYAPLSFFNSNNITRASPKAIPNLAAKSSGVISGFS